MVFVDNQGKALTVREDMPNPNKAITRGQC